VNVLRLWSVVLVANVVGALIFAFVLARTEAVEEHVFQALRLAAASAGSDSFSVALLRGVFAGWMIALVVWLGPFAESARVWVIIILTYVVGLTHLTHVIVTSVDGAFLAFVGDSTWTEFLLHGFVPGLIGNIIGGVAMVAALNHAQVTAGGSVDV
jgi:formate/nitrite transporter FocA (FNT family)